MAGNGHDKLVVFSCKRRGFSLSGGALRMAQTAAHLADHVTPRVPVRQWERVCQVRLPIPLRLLLAAQPKLVRPVLQVVHRAITRFLLDQAGLKTEQADSGAFTLVQRFGSAANLNIHLHCLVLDGVYRCDTDGEPVFVEAPAPSDEALQAVLHKITTRTMKLLTRRGGARRRAGPNPHGRQRQRFGRRPHNQAVASRGVYLSHRLRWGLRLQARHGGQSCEGQCLLRKGAARELGHGQIGRRQHRHCGADKPEPCAGLTVPANVSLTRCRAAGALICQSSDRVRRGSRLAAFGGKSCSPQSRQHHRQAAWLGDSGHGHVVKPGITVQVQVCGAEGQQVIDPI